MNEYSLAKVQSISGDASVKERMTDEAIKGMVNSMLGE